MVPGPVATDRVWCSGLAKCARWMVSGATGRSFLRKGHDDDVVVLAGMRDRGEGLFFLVLGWMGWNGSKLHGVIHSRDPSHE